MRTHISIFKPSKVTCNTRNQDLNAQTAAMAWNYGHKIITKSNHKHWDLGALNSYKKLCKKFH